MSRDWTRCLGGAPFRVISKESHSGTVPMNHSNKDGTSLAESEEGRLLIKENTFPSCTYPTQSGSARVPRVGKSRTAIVLLAFLLMAGSFDLSRISRVKHGCGSSSAC